MVTCCAVIQGDRRPLLAENGSINAQQDEVDTKTEEEEEEVNYRKWRIIHNMLTFYLL